MHFFYPNNRICLDSWFMAHASWCKCQALYTMLKPYTTLLYYVLNIALDFHFTNLMDNYSLLWWLEYLIKSLISLWIRSGLNYWPATAHKRYYYIHDLVCVDNDNCICTNGNSIAVATARAIRWYIHTKIYYCTIFSCMSFNLFVRRDGTIWIGTLCCIHTYTSICVYMNVLSVWCIWPLWEFRSILIRYFHCYQKRTYLLLLWICDVMDKWWNQAHRGRTCACYDNSNRTYVQAWYVRWTYIVYNAVKEYSNTQKEKIWSKHSCRLNSRNIFRIARYLLSNNLYIHIISWNVCMKNHSCTKPLCPIEWVVRICSHKIE